MTATDQLPEVPQEQPRCDHICLKDADHVKRGERHFYGYELPSPRDLAAALRATETQRDAAYAVISKLIQAWHCDEQGLPYGWSDALSSWPGAVYEPGVKWPPAEAEAIVHATRNEH